MIPGERATAFWSSPTLRTISLWNFAWFTKDRFLQIKGKHSRTKYKHQIRKEFHKQLRELWNQHPSLRAQAKSYYRKCLTPDNQISYPGPNKPIIQILNPGEYREGTSFPPDAKTWIDHVADDYKRLGTRFVPLISESGGFTCSLDVLFMRRDAPGNVFLPGSGGGDIDNRLKTLFDSLKMPESITDLGGIAIPLDEDPFFCLLTDDGLITRVSITSDRLLSPKGEGERINDVYIVVHVTMGDETSIFSGGRLV
jgi:hypothetical protein